MSLIILGQCEVSRGRKGDPQRVVKMVGNHPHRLGDDGLEPYRFPEIASWPKGQCQLKLAVVNYHGEYFQNFSMVRDRLKNDPELVGWQKGGFPELMSDKLWESLQKLWDGRIWRVYAPAPEAVWLNSYRYRCAPCVRCDPDDRNLSAYWVDYVLDGRCCFLLSRKVGEALGS